jgi:hypothetical protein
MAKNYKLSNTYKDLTVNSPLIYNIANNNLSFNDQLTGLILDNTTTIKNLSSILFNNNGDTHTSKYSFSNITKFGFNHIFQPTDGPTTNQFYSITFGIGNSSSITENCCQLAFSREQSLPYIYIRYIIAGAYSSWNIISTENSVNSTDSFINNINFDGEIGIGKTPEYSLDVSNSYDSIGSANTSYFNAGSLGNFITNSTYFSDICARFSNSIWCGYGFVSASDMRIKKNIEDINDDLALQQILSIQPKTYNYIDIINRGDKKVYGFIAQQIKEVIPEAVIIEPGVIPNIYKNGLCLNNVITMDDDISSIIKINDTIDIIDYNNKRDSYKVLSVENNKFTIDKNIDTEKVFIYGIKIEDFHAISKEYIFTLNVCATQELYKRIEEQNKIIQEQKNNINNLILKFNNIKQKYK